MGGEGEEGGLCPGRRVRARDEDCRIGRQTDSCRSPYLDKRPPASCSLVLVPPMGVCAV